MRILVTEEFAAMVGNGGLKRADVTSTQRNSLAREFRRMYDKGASIRAIADKHGKSYGFVHRVLAETGPLRSHKAPPRSETGRSLEESDATLRRGEVVEAASGQPKVFFCYSRDDAEYARRLAEVLEASGVDVSLDSKLELGSDFAVSIRNEIESADFVVALLSPGFFKSTWCKFELASAMTEGKRVIPLRLRGDIEGPLAHVVSIQTANDLSIDAEQIEAAIGSDESRSDG